MFTGIIEDLGKVIKLQKGQDAAYFEAKSEIFTDQKIGNSIAVNGVCLTISNLKNDIAGFDIMQETLKKSNLGNLKLGEMINLERALKIGDRLAGHFVTGHIDCAGRIIAKTGNAVTVKIARENIKYTVAEGSIALNGISLTIAEVGIDNFSVCLIPHTLKNTNLQFRKIGDELNVEFDLIGKYALKSDVKKNKESKITEEFLKEKGFI